MRSVLRRLLVVCCLVAVPPVGLAAPVPAAPGKAEGPIAAARKALDEVSDMNYQSRTLNDVINDLKEKAKIPVILDNLIFTYGLNPNQPVVTVNLKQVKLKDGLKAALAPLNLSYGLTRDGLIISSEEGVIARQMRQLVSLNCDGTDFSTAIDQLASETGTNLVVDPRLGSKAKKPVTLKLEGIPLETAVRLLAELADLQAVRMNNVLFVTTPERAKILREDADGPTKPIPAIPTFFAGDNAGPFPGIFGAPAGIGGPGAVPVPPAGGEAVPPPPPPAPADPPSAPAVPPPPPPPPAPAVPVPVPLPPVDKK